MPWGRPLQQAGARSCRDRREIQRDPRRPGAARRTGHRQGHTRHPGCPALPKKAFNVAQAGNISLIVQVKDNQPTLKQAIHHIATSGAPYDVFRTRDRGRNRDETRTVAVFDPASALAGTDWHPHVTAIIQVERAVATRNPETGLLKLTHDTAFY
ncbi:Transposase, partial [Acidiphilium sp. PM]